LCPSTALVADLQQPLHPQETYPVKRFLVLALAAALSVTASACSDTTSPGAVLAGTYTLRTVNNQQPPVIIYADPTGTQELLGGQIRLDQNGNYTDVVTLRDTPPGGSPGPAYDDTINGYWSLSGNTLTLTDVNDPNNPYFATVSNGSLIFTNYASGTQYTVVYSK
jgi:hypothetical protein